MTTKELTVCEIATPHKLSDEHKHALRLLSLQWQDDQEFWTFDSCLETMASRPGIITGFACSKAPNTWLGWYLASFQNDQAELLFIYTAKTARRQGVARLLLRHLIDRLQKEPGCTTLFLEVRPQNRAAVTLYHDFNFHLLTRRTNYYRNGDDALVYQLSLQ
jgi:ribosomal protein S18 acetylase RimI-like enzyme